MAFRGCHRGVSCQWEVRPYGSHNEPREPSRRWRGITLLNAQGRASRLSGQEISPCDFGSEDHQAHTSCQCKKQSGVFVVLADTNGRTHCCSLTRDS